MIIDAHTHVFNKRAGISLEAESKYFQYREVSGDYLVASMDYAGVDKAFLISYDSEDIACSLLSQNTQPVEMRNVMSKEYCLEIISRYPGRFYWFADHIDPGKGNYMDVLEENIEIGATGIKLMTAFCGAYPDDPRLMRVYEVCCTKGIPVIIDFCYWYIDEVEYLPLKIKNKDYKEYLMHMSNVAESFPEVNFQIAHYGTPGNHYSMIKTGEYKAYEPFIELLAAHDNLFTDLAALPFPDYEEYPFPSILKFLKHLIRNAGSGKVIYGTDWPYFCNGIYYDLTYRQGVNLIKNADFLDSHEKDMILGNNALNFLRVKIQK